VRIITACALALTLASCVAVHPEDLQSWVGAPVDQLDKHPIFLTMQAVRTRTADHATTSSTSKTAWLRSIRLSARVVAVVTLQSKIVRDSLARQTSDDLPG
jgi:hypothetical protein